ncbi:MAG: LysM peptidoglycan-binding domain-containing protein [Solirubrobacteraceae bacterium]
MFSSLRVVLLAVTLSIVVVGVLIASAVLNATSGGPPVDLASPAAMAQATRTLPPYWVVRPGDTFNSIAAANRLSVAQLQQLNPTQDPTALVPGQSLRLHVHESSTRVIARPAPPFWTLRPGDTYSSVAAKTGVPIGAIAQYNPKLNPNLLVPGQRLKLRP